MNWQTYCANPKLRSNLCILKTAESHPGPHPSGEAGEMAKLASRTTEEISI
jgi:hypothetical protein